MDIKELILQGKTYLGIEFGSTRIKGVLIDKSGTVLASGDHEWENRFEDGVWTYSLDDVWNGIKDCYGKLKADVSAKYDVRLTTIGAIGISAMMHGYLAFDAQDNLLVPFRTWRNTITEQAACELTELFNYNIPQRWSISHLYQAMLNKEEHVSSIAFFTTLAGYVHYMLTGKKVLGVGDASGMFPIDIATKDYDKPMIDKFDTQVASMGYTLKLGDILPKSLLAGQDAGELTEAGALLLDPSGDLKSGVKLAPPEGDAGTGMVATNSVKVRTGNTSAGTSVFAMVVLEKELTKVYQQIDLVTTPDGALVGMVHCNNCTSDINAWVNLFDQNLKLFGCNVDKNTLYTKLFEAALDGDADCGGLISYNYYSGEPVTGFDKGAPLFVRKATDNLSLSNFMRMNIYSSLASLKVGLDILLKKEGVKVDEMFGHGGLFKTKGVGQSVLAAAINSPVSVMETAGEGGPWGMAILASYLINNEGDSLPDYLSNVIFAGQKGEKLEPKAKDVEGFDEFLRRYDAGIPVEIAAAKVFGC